MNKTKKAMCLLLSLGMVMSTTACAKTTADVTDVFKDNNKISYSQDYTELSSKKKNKTDSWRQGMVSGNGLQGVVTSSAPYSDTFIFQNMHFILPNDKVRYCPDTSDELEDVKQNIVKSQDITDDASYDDVYRYHPGGELRLEMEKKSVKDYIRYTDYETAEVGVRYSNKDGVWNRKTFTSHADGVTITKLEKSSQGAKVNAVLSYDNISVLANFGNSDEVNLKYKKVVSDDCSTISMISHYPNYENSELKNGGYATLTYVVAVGGTKEKVLGKEVEDEQYVSNENPQIKITDADELYLITVSDRTYDMGSIDDFEKQNQYDLLDELEKQTKAVVEKYNKNNSFDYETALNNHLSIYQPQFDAVTFTLDGDNIGSNEALIKKQKGKSELNSALAQRAYYSGRYAYLCCSGYSTSRLYGMWTGEWDAGWGSKYTMDANVNLQTSSMNTGHIPASYIGYTYFILRQLPDWEENAKATHGFTDAIQAPVNTDGDKAVITETCYPYPFRYWNAGASWMIQPLYETLKCYGNVQIPLSDEFDLNSLKSVLSVTSEDLSDKDIKKIQDKGYLELKEDILVPLLTKSVNYWQQLMTPEYYTDSKGDIHYEKGKTALGDDEYYCILPSYSPENNPANYPSPSTANCAIDISACKNNIEMLIDIISQTNPKSDTSQLEYLMKKLPPYLYDETGALKEWACNQFEENNEHRHLSHLYGVWPLTETQNDEDLKKACIQAIANRESENKASHALVHRSLICARLKDSNGLTDALSDLMSSKIYYDSLMTNHHMNARSAYCTDFAIGYLGIINESLVYSDKGEIQILPALPTSGFEKGKITGLMARTQAEIVDLSWDTQAKKASVTIKSNTDQKIKVSCFISGEAEDVQFKQGETKTFDFNL